MGLLAFTVSVLYWPGIAGAATTPRWALLFAVVPWLVGCTRWTTAHLFGALFIGWAALSLFWTADTLDSINALLILGLSALIFNLGYELQDLRPVYVGAGIGIAISGVIASFQVAEINIVRGYGPAGLFVNPIFLGEAAGLVLVGAVGERLWLVAAIVTPALALSAARAAMLGGALALAIHFRNRWRLLLAIAVVAGLAVAAYSWGRVRLDSSELERLAIWRSTWAGVTWLGHGIGSFWSTYPQFDIRPHPPRRPEFAHNEWLNVAFELGPVGFVLFCSWCISLAGPLNSSRLVLITLAVESCFAFPLHLPTTAFLGMLCAGHAVRDRAVLRDLAVHSRRTLPPGLAVAGFCRIVAAAGFGGANHAVRASISRGGDKEAHDTDQVRA